MQKLIRKHQFITAPDSKNISYFGLSWFARDYLLRLHSVNHNQYFKTRYGIMHKHRISNWITNVSKSKNISNPEHFYGNRHQLSAGEKLQMDRFCIEQDQPFSQLRTVQFDVELAAPIAMRILQLNYDVYYYGPDQGKIYQAQWLYKVEIVDKEGFKNRKGLMTEQQYEKSNKIIEYQGMLL